MCLFKVPQRLFFSILCFIMPHSSVLVLTLSQVLNPSYDSTEAPLANSDNLSSQQSLTFQFSKK